MRAKTQAAIDAQNARTREWQERNKLTRPQAIELLKLKCKDILKYSDIDGEVRRLPSGSILGTHYMLRGNYFGKKTIQYLLRTGVFVEHKDLIWDKGIAVLIDNDPLY